MRATSVADVARGSERRLGAPCAAGCARATTDLARRRHRSVGEAGHTWPAKSAARRRKGAAAAPWPAADGALRARFASAVWLRDLVGSAYNMSVAPDTAANPGSLPPWPMLTPGRARTP